MLTPESFVRINSDGNGNPRFVAHFLDFLTEQEKAAVGNIGPKYDIALCRAREVGGGKFHNRQYGGGIVFQSYSLRETCADVNALIERDEKRQAIGSHAEIADENGVVIGSILGDYNAGFYGSLSATGETLHAQASKWDSSHKRYASLGNAKRSIRARGYKVID